MEDEADLYYGDLNEEALKPAAVVHAETEEQKPPKPSETPAPTELNQSTEKLTVMASPIIAMPFLHLYPIDNYTFGSKEALMEIETSYHNRMIQLEQAVKAEGMRRTVEAVLLTYQNNHPHVLLLQLGDSTIFKLYTHYNEYIYSFL